MKFTLLFIICLSQACSHNDLTEEAKSNIDDWATRVLPDRVYDQFYLNDNASEALSYPVIFDEVQNANLLLLEDSWKLLSDEDVFLYTGVYVSTPSGFSPYLLRGVYANERGNFHVVVSKGGNVLVNYISLGKVSLEKWPVVALLKRKPKMVYVTESGAY